MRSSVPAAAAAATAVGGAAAARSSAAVAKGKLTLVVVAAIAKGKLIVVVVVFREAPRTAAVFPEHPHIEGRKAVVPEVEGAPPTQAPHTGKRLPTAGPGHVACGGDLDPNP